MAALFDMLYFPIEIEDKAVGGLRKFSASMADPARMKTDTGSAAVSTEELQDNEVTDKGPAGSEAPAESTSQQSHKDDDKTVSETVLGYFVAVFGDDYSTYAEAVVQNHCLDVAQLSKIVTLFLSILSHNSNNKAYITLLVNIIINLPQFQCSTKRKPHPLTH